MPTKTIFQEKEILAQVAAGKEPAFRQLYDHYAARVYNMTLRYLDTPFLAQDIVQEVFTRVWQKRAGLPDLLNFEAWLTTVTRNLLINQLQKKIPSRLTDEAEDQDRPDPARSGQRAEYRELEAMIHEAPPGDSSPCFSRVQAAARSAHSSAPASGPVSRSAASAAPTSLPPC